MPRQCKITNKKRLVGNNVSHSKRRTKRVQAINLQYKRFWLPEQRRWIRIRVTTSAIRTIAKLGIEKALHKAGILKIKDTKKSVDQNNAIANKRASKNTKAVKKIKEKATAKG